MTNEELDNLDKLCAIHVMGFKTEHPPAALHPTLNPTYLWAHGVCVGVTGHQHSHRHWSPTRNIAQAWECLEQFGKEWIVTIEGPWTDGSWDVSLLYEGEYTKNYHRQADDAPLAIVLACLKAKGVKV